MNWITNSVLPKIKAWVKSDELPENLWIKCNACNQMIFHREFSDSFNCCPTCGHHAPLSPENRFSMLFDNNKYDLVPLSIPSDDPLKFRDSKKYIDRLRDTRKKTGLSDAIVVATGTINNYPTVIAAFDFRFMGGSMGRMVGNGIVVAAQKAIEKKAALITVPSTGGARMQEGVLSLMQLPRTIAAVEQVRESGLPYIVLLAHPTTGGVTASFAMLGDIQIAEPRAIVGFAGRRVIEETVREKLPDNFQTAEYLMDHGMVDSVIPRAEQHNYIGRLLGFLMEKIDSKK